MQAGDRLVAEQRLVPDAPIRMVVLPALEIATRRRGGGRIGRGAGGIPDDGSALVARSDYGYERTDVLQKRMRPIVPGDAQERAGLIRSDSAAVADDIVEIQDRSGGAADIVEKAMSQKRHVVGSLPDGAKRQSLVVRAQRFHARYVRLAVFFVGRGDAGSVGCVDMENRTDRKLRRRRPRRMLELAFLHRHGSGVRAQIADAERPFSSLYDPRCAAAPVGHRSDGKRLAGGDLEYVRRSGKIVFFRPFPRRGGNRLHPGHRTVPPFYARKPFLGQIRFDLGDIRLLKTLAVDEHFRNLHAAGQIRIVLLQHAQSDAVCVGEGIRRRKRDDLP